MTDNSDYNKPRTNLFDLLPTGFQSDTSRSVFENLFNRFLTKTEFKRVNGFAGLRNPNAQLNRQIQEPTVHRQGFQLQPIIYNKIGNVEHIASYKDILNELERLGVDIDSLKEWGNSLQFNWVPPVDIDKIVNFQNYLWFDPENFASKPQYITVKRDCVQAEAKLFQFQRVIELNGSHFEITDISATNNRFVVSGNLTEIFIEDFVFFIKASTNPNINAKFWSTCFSFYNEEFDRTIIEVNEQINDDSIIDGIISFDEYLSSLLVERDCKCNGTIGWDIQQWDDNQVGDVIWNTDLLLEISSNTEPTSPVTLDLWFDTINDELNQFNGTDWITIQGNFSLIVNKTLGTNFWDFSSHCTTVNDDPHLNQWISQNKWVHKNEISNLATAKQAQMPIIEFDNSLELNEWLYIKHNWKYRSSKFVEYNAVDTQPNLFEIHKMSAPNDISIDLVENSIIIDEKFGNLTDVFTAGYTFKISGGANVGSYTVTTSFYKNINGNVYNTIINVQETLATDVLTSELLEPIFTSNGDVWETYDNHWVYVDASDAVAINHQVVNPLLTLGNQPPLLEVDGNATASKYLYITSDYSQEYTLTKDIIVNTQLLFDDTIRTGTNRSLKTLSLANQNDVYVYVNNIRQYGNYTEITENIGGVEYVVGISFNIPLEQFTQIRVELGEPALNDFGLSSATIRTIEDDDLFTANGPETISLISLKRHEQIKTKVNQYPLFDVYDIEGNTANVANRIFAFKENQNFNIDLNVGFRIEHDFNDNFVFEQFLVVENNGEMYAYRDYSKEFKNWWFDELNQCMKYFDGKTWNDRTFVGDYIINFVESEEKPGEPFISIDGFIWFDLINKQLKRRVADSASWELVPFESSKVDPSLRTIWRKGLNNENYIPEFVDSERNPVPIGSESGDWEIPDQLYFNNKHENRKEITKIELLSHVKSIIQQQKPIPGFIGSLDNMYHIIDDPNYGVGGTIHEYNDSYDLFLSSIFNKNVTPSSLIEFAQNQYENSLNTIKELLRRNILTLLSDTSDDSLSNLTEFMTESIITQYELNDSLNLVYKDSNTITDQGGMKNWIATLPFVKLGFGYDPVSLVDSKLNLNGMSHHDGHLSNIKFLDTLIESINKQITNVDDVRTNPLEKLGRTSNTNPPSNITDFSTNFSTQLRGGVYWYNTNTRELFRLSVVGFDTNEPSSDLDDGVLWIDTLTNTLRKKVGSSWVPVSLVGDGIIAAAWEKITINTILNSIILEVETRLNSVIPKFDKLNININDFIKTPEDQHRVDLYLEEAFNDYIHKHNIEAPFSASLLFNINDPFTWNYKTSVISLYPSTENNGNESGGVYQDLYQKIYGTPYPHLEPWKLQKFKDKPTWWDDEYKDLSGFRRWKYDHVLQLGMWENIRVGVIPSGRKYPNGKVSTGNPVVDGEILPKYSYFSVNISQTTITTGSFTYNPDDLFPPFWDFTATFTPTPTGSDVYVRSVFFDFNSHIFGENLDYKYGDAGLEEWKWRNSSQFLYDELNVLFRIQPIKFINQSFGNETVVIDGLEIDRFNKKVYSHSDIIWHGEIVNKNEISIIAGINQWYVNYNRFLDFDINFSDFRSMWADWTAQLGYQFATFLNTSTIDIDNPCVSITDKDYFITMKRSPGIEDFWLDSFKVSVLKVPPKIVRLNNEHEWKFNVDIQSPVGRSIDVFGVHNYEFFADSNTNSFKLNTFKIQDVDLVNNTFSVNGNKTNMFPNNVLFEIFGSLGNDGQWKVVTSVFNPSVDRTFISVEQPILDINTNGYITADFRKLPWDTGQKVILTTHNILPSPLNESTEYFIIRLNDIEFQLAETEEFALNGSAINISNTGTDEHFVGQLKRTFKALNGSNISLFWKHYEIDETFVESIIPPIGINGVQNLIDFIDGYVYGKEKDGFSFNHTKLLVDNTTGRLIDWQLEQERFIDAIFQLRTSFVKATDTFEVIVDDITDIFTYTNIVPGFKTGTRIKFNTSGSLPSPLLRTGYYFIIQMSQTEFKLALTLTDAIKGNALTIFDTGSGNLEISKFAGFKTITTREINAFRNAVWFNHEQGVVADLIKGPFEDVRTEQTIFDQYGRTLKNPLVFREDTLTQLKNIEGIVNDVQPQIGGFLDPTKFIHFGGAHLFLDGYEHIILFSDYTTDNILLYDSFIGLNTPKFNFDFEKQVEFTQRPNVGGYYLHENGLQRNFESAAGDIQNFYDTNTVQESLKTMEYSRGLLGYEGTESYLDQLNINPKSQFLFWRGMIQNKGSINSINAFINSRQFVDAKIDEYWAYKLADFGSTGEKEYPALNLFTDDAINDDLRLHFVENDEAIKYDFIGIELSDETRWQNHPDVVKTLENETNMYFESKIIEKKPYIVGGNEPLNLSIGDGWVDIVDSNNILFKTFNGSTFVENGNYPYFRHDLNSDAIRITFEYNLTSTETKAEPTVTLPNTLTLPTPFIINSNSLEIYVNGNIMVGVLDYFEESNDILLSETIFTTKPIRDFDIISVDNLTSPNSFVINGIHLDAFAIGDVINVSLSGANDGIYTVTSVSDNTVATFIEVAETIPSNLPVGKILDKFTVIYKNGEFAHNLHYNTINDNVIEFNIDKDELFNVGFADSIIHEFAVWGLDVNPDALNPTKIIDVKSKVVLKQSPLWHPSKNHHYFNAINIVDIQNDEDPALYTDTLDTLNDTPNDWNVTEVGTVWLDTFDMDYVPYSDVNLYPELDDRLSSWGNLTNWGEVRIYEWTESDVHPTEYDAIAQSEQNTISIPESIRKSGNVRKVIFKRTRLNYEASGSIISSASLVIPLNTFAGNIVESDITGVLEPHSQIFRITTASTQTFTLTKPYIVGSNILSVTVNGSPVTFTEDNSTQFTITSVTTAPDDLVISTVEPPTYTTEIVVNGVSQIVSLNSNTIQSYDNLITALNNAIQDVTVELLNNNIVITNNTVGGISELSINDDLNPIIDLRLFQNLDRIDGAFNPIETVNGVDSLITTNETHLFENGDEIRVSTTGELPAPLDTSTKYIISDKTTNTFRVKDENGDYVELTTIGNGVHVFSEFSFNDDWTREQNVKERFDVSIDESPFSTGNPVRFDLSNIEENSIVDIYVNGKLTIESHTVIADINGAFIELNDMSIQDVVDVILPKHIITDDELSFDPDTTDDGTIHVQYKEDIDFTTVTTITPALQESQKFYFWVENKVTRNDKLLSILEAKTQIVNTPDPYVVMDGFKHKDKFIFDDTLGLIGLIHEQLTPSEVWVIDHNMNDYPIVRVYINDIEVDPESIEHVNQNQTVITFNSAQEGTVRLIGDMNRHSVNLPSRYTQLIVRRLRGIVTEDYRFVLRFLRDFTLRDTLEKNNEYSVDIKNLHTEWELIREKQPFLIPRTLWDKVTETMIGFKLDDNDIRIPSLERELYDNTFNTDTRFGLGDNQSFSEKTMTITTVVSILSDQTNDFKPIDINVFFDTHDFTTSDGIVDTMNVIYNTFPTEIVNKIFFAVLHDALSLKLEYPDIFKTSFISLHGIKILGTDGAFDD